MYRRSSPLSSRFFLSALGLGFLPDILRDLGRRSMPARLHQSNDSWSQARLLHRLSKESQSFLAHRSFSLASSPRLSMTPFGGSWEGKPVFFPPTKGISSIITTTGTTTTNVSSSGGSIKERQQQLEIDQLNRRVQFLELELKILKDEYREVHRSREELLGVLANHHP
jgi:hypothetical protein